jgi:DNA-binding IclR family transcriptional regulator
MNNYVIPNLVKACEIMKILADRPKGISASQAENLTEIPRTTAFRILKTLCSEGMAEKRGTLFFAGPGLVQIGLTSLRSLEIRSMAMPFLSELASKTHFTAHLAISSGWQSLILEVHDSPNPVRVASRSGATVPLHCSSTGKIFLAYLHEQELEDYFSSGSPEKKTSNTIVTLDEMQKEIAKIKRNGFSVDDHEFHKDVWCVASPVRDSDGKVIAAIGVTGPAMQSDDQKKNDICMYVKKAAGELSSELGYVEQSN